MAETDPLILSNEDSEAGYDSSVGKRGRWRARIAERLETRTVHKTVISLVAIDGACVLADLAYTVLSDSCESTEGPDSPRWLEVLSYISLVITSLFLLELPLNLWVFGLKYFNPIGLVTHAGLHLFDAIIIVTTFVLEVVLRGKERELAELLILFRLWRLVKLVGGLAVGAGELDEEIVNELRETKERLHATSQALADAHGQNVLLRARLATLDGNDDGN